MEQWSSEAVSSVGGGGDVGKGAKECMWRERGEMVASKGKEKAINIMMYPRALFCCDAVWLCSAEVCECGHPVLVIVAVRLAVLLLLLLLLFRAVL